MTGVLTDYLVDTVTDNYRITFTGWGLPPPTHLPRQYRNSLNTNPTHSRTHNALPHLKDTRVTTQSP